MNALKSAEIPVRQMNFTRGSYGKEVEQSCPQTTDLAVTGYQL